MAYKKEQIETIISDIAATINISDAMFNKADAEYTSLGKWIDKKTEDGETNFKVYIYPHGSFALGTVIKPISDKDDYDLDLVCQVENGDSLSAEQLKNDVVKPWLASYKKTKSDIEEKRRCWHVEYEEIANFHMDVIPAIPQSLSGNKSTMILITDKDEHRDPIYEYQGSNPKGYVNWFFSRCSRRKSINADGKVVLYEMAQQEDLRQNKNKTKLQKAVQILKRHRDIMFETDLDNKPISIIITTLAGQIYCGEETILDTLLGFVNGVENYLNSNKKEDGNYSIPNPSYKGEDFADKWKEHPERQEAFFSWIKQLKADFNLQDLMNRDRVGMGKSVKKIFGAATGTLIFGIHGLHEAREVKAENIKVDPTAGRLSTSGTVAIPPSHHYGEI